MKKRITVGEGILLGGAILALILAIKTLLQTPTLILSSWFLVLFYTPILIGASLGIGCLLRLIGKNKYSLLRMSAFVLLVLAGSFVAFNYTPTYTVEVPEDYAGDVTLLVSNRAENELKVNQYGIGYITKKTYQQGFKPRVVRAGEDITDQTGTYSTGSFFSLSDTNSYEFVEFVVKGVVLPKYSRSKFEHSLESMTEAGVIDEYKLSKE